jgi:hypothetical protein
MHSENDKFLQKIAFSELHSTEYRTLNHTMFWMNRLDFSPGTVIRMSQEGSYGLPYIVHHMPEVGCSSQSVLPSHLHTMVLRHTPAVRGSTSREQQLMNREEGTSPSYVDNKNRSGKSIDSECLMSVHDTQLFTLLNSKGFICPTAWIQASACLIATWRRSQIPGMLHVVWKPAIIWFWRVSTPSTGDEYTNDFKWPHQ